MSAVSEFASENGLSAERVGQIKKVVAQLLPPGSHAWIFGSILDVKKRGGDIDLYIEVETPDLRTRGKLRNEISKIADGKKWTSSWWRSTMSARKIFDRLPQKDWRCYEPQE